MAATELCSREAGQGSLSIFQNQRLGSCVQPEVTSNFNAAEHERRTWIVDGCEFVRVMHKDTWDPVLASSAPSDQQQSEAQSQNTVYPARCTSQQAPRAQHALPPVTGADKRSPLPANLGAAAAFLTQAGAIHRITVFQSLLISDMQDPESPPGFPLTQAIPLFERATTRGLDEGWSSAEKYFRAEPSIRTLAEEYFALLSWWEHQFTHPFLREHRAGRGDEFQMAIVHLLVDIRHEGSKRWAVAV